MLPQGSAETQSTDCQRCPGTPSLAAAGERPTTGALQGGTRVLGRAATHTQPQHLPALPRSGCCSCHAWPRASFNPGFSGHAERDWGSGEMEAGRLCCSQGSEEMETMWSRLCCSRGWRLLGYLPGTRQLCKLKDIASAPGWSGQRIPKAATNKTEQNHLQAGSQTRTQSRGLQCPPLPLQQPLATRTRGRM